MRPPLPCNLKPMPRWATLFCKNINGGRYTQIIRPGTIFTSIVDATSAKVLFLVLLLVLLSIRNCRGVYAATRAYP